MNAVVGRYAAAVQAAQQEYLATMGDHWARVVAGELPEAGYWRIAGGEPLAKCKAQVRAATAEYDAAWHRG